MPVGGKPASSPLESSPLVPVPLEDRSLSAMHRPSRRLCVCSPLLEEGDWKGGSRLFWVPSQISRIPPTPSSLVLK